MDHEPGQFILDVEFGDIWLVLKVWKNSIRLVALDTGTTMQASYRHNMKPPTWRLVGQIFE